MPLLPSDIEERLSLAYVQAIVASAGADYKPYPSKEWGLDCDILRVANLPSGKQAYTDQSLSCQVKATTRWIQKPNLILYDLKADAYNKLVAFEIKPVILILLKLPLAQNKWVNCAEDSLELRNCCYWMIVKGDPTVNTSSIRISIPRSQIFNQTAVNNLLDKLEHFGSLQ